MAEENTGNPDSVVIDIWESESCLIHRVPRKLRKVKEEAYTPQLISIGPFHYGNDDLREMEGRKKKYYDAFLKRSENIKEVDLKNVIEDCYERLRNSYAGICGMFENKRQESENNRQESEDKSQESEDNRHESEKNRQESEDKRQESEDKRKRQEFEDMIRIDACFIIELFLRNENDDEKEGKKDCILRTPWLRKAIKLDLILLENQLPFFILKKLYKIVKRHLPPVKIPKPKSDSCSCSTTTLFGGCICGTASFTCCQVKRFGQNEEAQNQNLAAEDDDDDLLKLAQYFFQEHFLTESSSSVRLGDNKKIKHFTDLLREFWLPNDFKENPKQEDITERKYLYSATKLDTAGVTFEPRKGKSLTDVKISKKPFLKFMPAMNCMQLKLPELNLENDTECLLRNVMALEQCVYPEKDYICGYVALMDQLINTREDVEFLVDKKIITNLLGSNKEAAKLINSLCNQIPRDKSYYADVYNELNTFYKNRWNVTRATFKKVYLKDLWTGSSTVVGICVLLFTVSATLKNVYFRHL